MNHVDLLDLPNKNPATVVAFEPDFVLRQKIGNDVVLKDVFTPERIESCQKIIEESRDAFFAEAEREMRLLLQEIEKKPESQEEADRLFENVFARVSDIKGQVEIFGFVLMRNICGHILQSCCSEHEPPGTRYMLIKDLVQVLHLSIREMVVDEGGMTGQAMVSDLGKYRARVEYKK